MKFCYLAGPITGLTYAQAEYGWRTEFEAWITRHHYCGKVKGLSPLRGKGYLESQGVLAKQYLNLHELSSPQGIVRRDFNDVKTCDAVLANFLGTTKVSLGTSWEMGAAYALQKPVVVILEKGSVHDHPFIAQSASYTFSTFEEAMPALMLLLGI
jgi:nucleoside 2-deoxyribosyltransferase